MSVMMEEGTEYVSELWLLLEGYCMDVDVDAEGNGKQREMDQQE